MFALESLGEAEVSTRCMRQLGIQPKLAIALGFDQDYYKRLCVVASEDLHIERGAIHYLRFSLFGHGRPLER